MIRSGLATLASTIFAACALAQSQTSPPPNPQTPPPQTFASPNASAQAPSSAAIPNGPAVNAELNSSVDSKKAKVGDKVEAHTTEALKNGDVVVPKGTKLIGHVTQASARAKGDSDSSLAIQFDKALPKKEGEVPLNVVILAVAPPAQTNFGSSSPSPGSDATAGSPASTQTSPMGASHPQTPPSTSSPGNYPAANGTSADTGSNGPSGAGPLPANSRGVYGLKDLKLMMSTSKENAGTTVITSTGKDVRLDSGTRLLLVTQTGTPSASAQ